MNKKKFYKRKLFWGLIIALAVVICGVFGFMRAKKAVSDLASMQKTNMSVAVERGDLSKYVEGSGSIEAAGSADVKIPTGITVSEILVEKGDPVTSGQVLANIDDTSLVTALISIDDSLDRINERLKKDKKLTSLQKEELNSRKGKLQSKKEELKALRADPVIRANADGIIQNINVHEEEPTVKNNTVPVPESGSENTGNTETITQMAYVTHMEIQTVYTESENIPEAEGEPVVITDFRDLARLQPVTGEKVINEFISSEMRDDTPVPFLKGDIQWTSDSPYEQGDEYLPDAVYTGVISLSPFEGYIINEESYEYIKLMLKRYPGYELIKADETGITVGVIFEKTEPAVTPTPEPTVTPEPKPTQTPTPEPTPVPGSDTIPFSDGGADLSGVSGSSSDDKVPDTSNLYDNTKMTAFTIQTQQNIKVVISIDEMDILYIKEGQKAAVTIDAIEDTEFEGEVTKIADTATEGNRAKFKVEVTVPKTDDMLIGMSASAVVMVKEAKNVLILPMDALQQRGDELIVYTEEGEDGSLSGEKTVMTGLSDGNMVEITSGIEEGETVYYSAGPEPDEYEYEYEEGVFVGDGGAG